MEKAVKENLKEIAKKKGLSFQEAFDYVFDKVSRHLVGGNIRT